LQLSEATSKKSSTWKPFSLWMMASTAIVGLDQITKVAIVKWVPLYDRIPLNSFINITHQRNPGAAFSFLADAGGWQRWFFTGLTTIVSAVIVAWIFRLRKEKLTVLTSGLS